jgi:hypothetical protein
MAKFMAVHTLNKPMTKDEIGPASKAVKAHHTPDATWIKSWLQLNEEGKITKIICEWDGKNAESVAKALKTSVPDFPVDGVYPMGEIYAESYR